uniref:Protease-4 n=1 Tax=Candidatus Kentrum eta TaxID=2126337 RepID=A0A450VB78_9GAMM|nr:MAG: protease-4 [Candidatus Kentron sp. H]VFK02021.1 MAG: protease-4 [Candidatus Kentron sp. H]VFK05154.1 MAG: protease-4 [Candidatus Kentron sp. H]
MTKQDFDTAPPQDNPSPTWERDLLNRLAFAALKEQRRARRWGIFFRFALIAYLLLLLLIYLPANLHPSHSGGEHTALVEIRGPIAEGHDASADRVISGLRSAFEDKNTKGVVLRINSPGGSPVQAGYINDEIARLHEKYPDIPLHAVIMDICASGGYYVAVAADRIYADKSSIIGSIGVLIDGFGFVEAMEKLGVERRLLTAGEHKGLLDPFSPTDPAARSHLQSVLDELHRQFIQEVKEGRGDRLRGGEDELFNGLVWSGKQAVRLGLADALGNSSYVAREIIGAENIVDFTWERDYLERFAERLGAVMGRALVTGLATGPGHLR